MAERKQKEGAIASAKKEDVVEIKSRPTIEEIYMDHLSYMNIFLVYVCFATMLVTGYIEEFVERIKQFLGWMASPYDDKPGYAPLFKKLDMFWLRRFYQRIRDLFERPISTRPGPHINVMLRESKDHHQSFYFTGEEKKCLNLCSYNYLGFAEASGPVTDAVEQSIRQYSAAAASPRMEGGNLKVVNDLEKMVAEFVGKPAALVVAMGYATNSTVIPALAGGKGNLIISDTLNHASIVCGSRDSGARIRVFKHNDPEDLEKLLRDSIIEGQPRTRRPWKRIFIVVEGIYSMEGEIGRLREIAALKKKYKAYLYVDEAHSIGALGKTGRGVCEQTGVDPADVDILMGTFTKAFGSVGGYIAGSKEVIDYLRHVSYGSMYSTAMSAPCAQQALSALQVISGKDGTTEGLRRLKSLRENGNYFRQRLTEMGFHIIGDNDSPIVPMMVYHIGKMAFLSREMLRRGITIVVVGFPVTPLLLSRIRFCISAAHTREDLDFALSTIKELGEHCLLNYGLKDKH